ncbi:MAG: T9SS type A sorting domain-containing protein [Bacteroidetes bacterium]|nr:T9SS type A sorting domain-containing protein [Bacteroidota bacterium]
MTVTLENSIVTNATVYISNIIGQEFIHSVIPADNSLLKVDVSVLPVGNYFLKIVFGNQTAVAKIFKQQ